jgi:EAL domain-containing protein (putative c-di-GMP-specific phosphodiesterase class I)
VAILSQPIYRADVEALLRKVNAGQPLRSEPRLRSPALAALEGPGATALSDEERALLADLDRAAEREEFSLAYQPQVEREGERILGVEALLRWTHPTRGPVSPGVFIPLAEKAGRIAEVTAWVIDRVLAETQYLSGLQVSFNASALEFADEGFVDRLLAAVARTGYDARRLEVEITETAILRHETPVLESMKRLHAVGIGVALDDFGAGYSSLSHLRRYPFDKLKIDREFITDCSRDMESATVVHAVVSIGRALGMKVIAEGVETETQRNFLRIAGVYAMQGYLFGKPMPIDDLAPLIGAARAKARG